MDDGINMSMPVTPAYGGYGMNGGWGGFGGDGWWIILLLLAFNGGGFGGWGGFGGGFGGMYEFPWLLNGQSMINANTNAGFDHAATQTAIGDLSTAVTSGFGDVQTALCGGFAGVNATINNAQSTLAQQLYTNQISDLERSFAAQTASTAGMSAIQSQLAQCCCENRAGIADVKYALATEACADRAAVTAGVQRILDQLCQDKIDAKNDEIAQLRQEVLFARGQASQIAQNQAVIDGIYSRLDSCPVGTTPVYGRTPIFSCNGGCGCSGSTGLIG